MFSSEKAREVFKKSGRKTSWVADQLGVTIPYIQKVLNGHCKPSSPVVKLLAIVLECKEEDLYANREAAS